MLNIPKSKQLNFKVNHKKLRTKIILSKMVKKYMCPRAKSHIFLYFNMNMSCWCFAIRSLIPNLTLCNTSHSRFAIAKFYLPTLMLQARFGFVININIGGLDAFQFVV